MITKKRFVNIYKFIMIFVAIFFLISLYFKEITYINPMFHLYYVIFSSFVSLSVGIIALKELKLHKNPNIYLLSIGFIGVSIIYFFHGLSTPGLGILPFTSKILNINMFIFTGDFSRLWLSIFMFLQVVNLKNLKIEKFKILFIVLTVILLVFFLIIQINNPTYLFRMKTEQGLDTEFALLIKVITMVLLSLSSIRLFQSFKVLNNIPIYSQLMVSLFTIMSTLIFLTSKPWNLVWWFAHNVYLISFIVIASGLIVSIYELDVLKFFDIQMQISNKIQEIKNDYTDIKLINKMLEKRIYFDELTNLFNRNYLKVIDQALNNGEIYRITVLYIDIDGFKKVNDMFGHDYGDEVLKNVSNIILSNIREKDSAIRIGGDEFLIILNGIEDKQVIELITQRVINKISLIEIDRLNGISISASIGIAISNEKTKSLNELIKLADEAMYYVKNNGKNNYNIAK